MISLSNASLQRGSRILFENASLTIHSGQKLGVVGRNGCGKSSLFACLQGNLNLDQGALSKPDNLRIAAMAQETGGSSRSALDQVIDGDSHFRQLQRELEQAELASDQTAIGRLHGELDRIDGYTVTHRAEKLLSGLGFKPAEFSNPVSSFSGGWRVRLNLAAALMCPSDLLLLDEPTNHLDLEATLWLEQWLIGYQGTLLIISHDREFLDRVIRHVVSFENGRIQLYRGNFSAYEKQKAARMALEKSMFEKQQRRRTEIESFVRRFRAKASKAKQAQSRVKELQRMEEIALAHVDSPFQFKFREPEKLPDHLLAIEHLDVGFSEPLVTDINLSLRADSRIGLLGVNGSGKSTLLKIIGGQLAPLEGKLQKAKHLRIGYFAQHQVDVLEQDASPLEVLTSIDSDVDEQSVRDYLGGFDFRGDRIDSKIGNFSGGEKVRLALAVIAWQKPNLLLLDEPTNHLDLEMRHALTVALQEFAGAIIVVSHDRHLLNNTVSEFYAISRGRLSRFDGDLADYQKLVQREQNTSEGASGTGENASGTEEATAVDKRAQRQQAAARRQLLAPLKKQITKLESTMEQLGKKLVAIDEKLLDSSLYEDANRARLKALLLEQGAFKSDLAETEEKWLELSEKYQDL
ncbi:MAG: ATP-binding cassette domain-containing protein [Gammaproteobacteria bacterium]|nr:ATP-binding cassette domain-containing protein [Gammaproteobacteria bacterium]